MMLSCRNIELGTSVLDLITACGCSSTSSPSTRRFLFGNCSKTVCRISNSSNRSYLGGGGGGNLMILRRDLGNCKAIPAKPKESSLVNGLGQDKAVMFDVMEESKKPISLENLFEVVADDLQRLNNNLLSIVGAENPVLLSAAEQIFGAGGKRMRPGLVFLVSRATAELANLKELTVEHRRLAEIIEMIHTASLIHDDVLDESDMRRGKETVHERKDYDFVKSSLSAEGFDVVYDINGREAEEVEPIIDALPKLEQYIYCSSAGVYLKSDLLPHCEVDAVDPKSRHKGKLETETLLESKGVNWTSIRPVYIYGPLNYNPVEEWFFHRLKAGRPIPVPNSGLQISQLGHVKDLAKAFLVVLNNEKASREIFNISGDKYVTFDGLAKACAKAGGFPEPEIVHYNPKEFDFGKKKAFPFRDQHFFASIEKAKHVLGWKPEFDLVEGLTDSYNLDFGRGTFRKEADFTTDDMILSKKLVLQS